MYDLFRGDTTNEVGRIHYWNVARQTGKSYTLCVIAIEECLRKRKAQVKFASMDQKSARAIVSTQFQEIFEDCPDDLRPHFRQHDGLYYFPRNGSRLTIAGCDGNNIRKLRGQKADLGIVDEGAFISDLEKVIYSVLLPQTTTTNGRILVATTPAESAGHFSTQLAHQCQSKGAYAKFTVWDSCRLSDLKKGEICVEYGGQESTRWRREYLCEFVTDSTAAVVPEFTDEAEKEIVQPYARPEYFTPYTALDGGYTDAAGCLFGYIDFKTARLVVEAEWIKRGALGSDIAAAVALTENRLWQEYHAKFLQWRPEMRPLIPQMRVMDVDPEMAAQFMKNHGQAWSPISKSPGYKQAAVNQLNDFIKQRRLIITPECKSLIRQLHNATWATSRKTYKRDDIDAHYDLVDALIYMLQVADFVNNPYPGAVKNISTNHFSPEDLRPGPQNESEQALVNAFGLKSLEN